jgi:hypothetical protein
LNIQECQNKPTEFNCSYYVQSQKLNRLSIAGIRSTSRIFLSAGYNYLNTSSVLMNVQNVTSNELFALYSLSALNETASIAIDMSPGGILSDMFINFNLENSTCDLYRVHPQNEWRFYVRVYFFSQSGSVVAFEKAYSSQGTKNVKLTARHVSQNGTVLFSSTLIKQINVHVNATTTTATTTTATSTTASTTASAKTTTSTATTSITTSTFNMISTIELMHQTTEQTMSSISAEPRFNNISNSTNSLLDNEELSNLLITSKEDINGCLVNCSNNGYCSLSDRIQCQCHRHFAGSACQINTRPCSPKNNPCLNNSTCVERVNLLDQDKLDYECECAKNGLYYGPRCETKLNVCMNETCSNNGVCVDNSSASACSCFLYYYGERCEHREHQLETISTMIRAATIVAIIIIVCFYVLIVSCDLTKYFLCVEENNKKFKKPNQPFIIRLSYKNY